MSCPIHVASVVLVCRNVVPRYDHPKETKQYIQWRSQGHCRKAVILSYHGWLRS